MTGQAHLGCSYSVSVGRLRKQRYSPWLPALGWTLLELEMALLEALTTLAM